MSKIWSNALDASVKDSKHSFVRFLKLYSTDQGVFAKDALYIFKIKIFEQHFLINNFVVV